MKLNDAIVEHAAVQRQHTGMITAQDRSTFCWNILEPDYRHLKPFLIQKSEVFLRALARFQAEAVLILFAAVTFEEVG